MPLTQSPASPQRGTAFLYVGPFLSQMNLPSAIPVMLLPQCNVFPHGLLPLYIFEPRYRAMLQHALKTDRLLCIGNLQPNDDANPPEEDERIGPFSTAAVIRACVAQPDGTSHLVLQGMQRIRLLSWTQYEPFRIARIEPIETCCRHPSAAARKGQRLLQRVIGLIQQNTDSGRQLAAQLQKLSDPDHLVDFVAANLIRDPEARHPLLGLAEVEERLDFLLDLVPLHGEKPTSP